MPSFPVSLVLWKKLSSPGGKQTMKTKITIFAALAMVVLSFGLFRIYSSYANSGNSALFAAIDSGNIPEVRRLVENGADVNGVGSDDISPLGYAAMKGSSSAAQILVDHGANVKFKGAVGTTALYLSAQYGHPDITQMLLAKGADPNVKTDRGHSVLDVAESARRVRSYSKNQRRPPTIADFDQIIQMLQQAGARAGT